MWWEGRVSTHQFGCARPASTHGARTCGGMAARPLSRRLAASPVTPHEPDCHKSDCNSAFNSFAVSVGSKSKAMLRGVILFAAGCLYGDHPTGGSRWGSHGTCTS